ncbi:hypothetical protein UA3_02582 [Enterococcus faecium EnGen0263]|uniref:hypothetical protein n=1 Tax=Enterococcus faecium TaxID=1352 RepID=UPI0003300375|nr:hypothetical protein [Enterococcus faecium]EOH52456.1 hypothetical protein UA3_02582 [Enterococcus faecium EnGen0263]
MNLIKRGIAVSGLLVSVLAVGIFLGLFYATNTDEGKEDHEKYQQLLADYEELLNQNKQLENQINHKDEKTDESDSPVTNTPIKIDTEVKNIANVLENFMDMFDNLSTDNFEEKMPEIHPLMTENAQNNLWPYYKEDTNMQKIESHLEQSKNYILEQTEEKAEVISLAVLYKTFNGEQPYINRTIYQTHLKKEGDQWKIDSRKQYVVNDHFPKEMFNE